MKLRRIRLEPLGSKDFFSEVSESAAKSESLREFWLRLTREPR